MDQRGSTVTERFYSLEPGNFEQEIDKIWRATDAIKDCVVEQVSNGALSPVDGLAMVSAIFAHGFGYHQANGQPTQKDLLGALRPALATAGR